MGEDDALANRQADAESLRLGRIVWRKDHPELVLGNAFSVIPECDLGSLAFFLSPVAGYFQFAAAGHGVNGVFDDVDEDFNDLFLVDRETGDAFVQAQVEADPVLEVAGIPPRNFAQQRV